MKILFFVFFLFLTPSVLSENISDYEIEGLSIGDSLLKVLTREQIKSHEQNYYNDNKYIPVYFTDIIPLKEYQGIQFHYKYGDSEFKIEGIEGALFFENLSDNCFNKMQEVNYDLENMFKNLKKNETGIISHEQDPSGKSKYSAIYYELINGNIVIGCVNWHQSMKDEYNLIDNFRLGMYTSDLQNWIDSIAYN